MKAAPCSSVSLSITVGLVPPGLNMGVKGSDIWLTGCLCRLPRVFKVGVSSVTSARDINLQGLSQAFQGFSLYGRITSPFHCLYYEG